MKKTFKKLKLNIPFFRFFTAHLKLKFKKRKKYKTKIEYFLFLFFIYISKLYFCFHYV